MNLCAACGVTVSEFPFKTGYADYLLFDDRAVGRGAQSSALIFEGLASVIKALVAGDDQACKFRTAHQQTEELTHLLAGVGQITDFSSCRFNDVVEVGCTTEAAVM